MNRIILAISVVLMFVFGAAGVTAAAARQSQPGEALYPLRTWSAQLLHQQEKIQIHAGLLGNSVQTRSDLHERENLSTPQSTATFDPCNQTGTAALCGSNDGTRGDHLDQHVIWDQNETNHPKDDAHHQNGEDHHSHHESDHGHDGHD